MIGFYNVVNAIARQTRAIAWISSCGLEPRGFANRSRWAPRGSLDVRLPGLRSGQPQLDGEARHVGGY